MILGLALSVSVALVTPAATAATNTTSAEAAFIASVVSPAQKAQRKYGVPASVSIAQAILESDWGTSAVAKTAKNYFNTRCGASMTPSQFAALADAQVNKPYVLGAEVAITNPNPTKFDCSELVEWLFGRAGIRITDLAAAQYDATRAVPKGTSAKVGDLVFLRNNPARANGIGHVAVLTEKLPNGDWRIIEARGRAYGVVRSTLSYWKTRSYYAGLRRYAKFVLAGSDGVAASAATIFQVGCTTISSTRYSKFASITDSFAANAVAVTQDSAFKSARSVLTSVPRYVDAIAEVEQPKDPAGYAKKLDKLIDDYELRDYDVVPLTLVLYSGVKGAKVTALQYLLTAAGYTVKASGKYDSATVAAVKKYQSAKKLSVDGEAGPMTLTKLMATLRSGDQGDRVRALHALLGASGYGTNSGATFGATTLASVKEVQKAAGRTVSGLVDANTWAGLFMTLNATIPTITGVAEVGKKLTATGTWGPGSVNLSYQWYRGDSPISGATESTYTVDLADTRSTLKVAVSGSKPTYTTITLASAATATVPLLTMGATPVPTITGTTKVGQTLTAAPGTWAPDGVTLSYQWFRGSAAIPNATEAGYTIQPADLDATLTVKVTGTQDGYVTTTKISAATAKIAKGTLTAATPKIQGTTKVGQVLTAAPGAWAPEGVAFSYQWYRGGAAIANATKSTYTVPAADLNATLSVKVTGKLTGYTTSTKASTATAAIAKGTLTTATPKIKGTAKAGRTLTVVPGTWGPSTVKLAYQWYRGSTAIKGATATTYAVKSADKGHTVSVQVRGTKTGYTTGVKKAGVKIAA